MLPSGATVAPVIIATDKTKLTEFSGGKVAYPVYLTLGNIPKALRRKPSKQACVLIAYLPVETDLLKGTGLSQQQIGSRHQRLFHDAMRHILAPLIDAGKNGIHMTAGNGEVRHVFPILACYSADFPEQCLVACAKYGTCPKCQSPAKSLNSSTPSLPRTQQWTLNVMAEAQKSSKTINQYYNTCMSQDVSGSVYEPFWKDFPYTDIHTTITPDVLHQLYQGVIANLIDWCQVLLTPKELDARVRALPPAFGVRHFKNGFSILSQISGPERKHMAHILLGCLVGKVSGKALSTFRSLLDFLYLVQYKAHDNDTLAYMRRLFARGKIANISLLNWDYIQTLIFLNSTPFTIISNRSSSLGLPTITTRKCLNVSILILQRRGGVLRTRGMHFLKWSIGSVDARKSPCSITIWIEWIQWPATPNLNLSHSPSLDLVLLLKILLICDDRYPPSKKNTMLLTSPDILKSFWTLSWKIQPQIGTLTTINFHSIAWMSGHNLSSSPITSQTIQILRKPTQ